MTDQPNTPIEGKPKSIGNRTSAVLGLDPLRHHDLHRRARLRVVIDALLEMFERDRAALSGTV